MEDFMFEIGTVDGLDDRYVWFLPFGLILDTAKSDFQEMPKSEYSYVSVDGADGSVYTTNTYANKTISIVARTPAPLVSSELEALKAEISRGLDKTKDKFVPMYLQRTGMTFNVKYSGSAKFEYINAHHFALTATFEAEPYGSVDNYVEVVDGDVIVNDGDCDIGFVATISGGCVHPFFSVGDESFYYNGTVPSTSTLIIDAETDRCYLVAEDGTETNAMKKLTSGYKFMDIKRGGSYDVSLMNNSTKSHASIKYQKLYLWR